MSTCYAPQSFLAPPQIRGEQSHLFCHDLIPGQTADVYFCREGVGVRSGNRLGDALTVNVPLSGPITHTQCEIVIAAPHSDLGILAGRDVLRFVISFGLIRALLACDSGIRVLKVGSGPTVTDDPFVVGLAWAVLALAPIGTADGLHIGHLVRAVAAHVGQRYTTAYVGGFAHRHDRHRIELAKQILTQAMEEHPDMQAVADACGLSLRGFHRAFREATGKPPLTWLRVQRIARARSMLAEGNMSLAEIAAECGFSDQSHFTRTFTHATGIAPGRWRRTHAAAPGDLVLAGGARTNQQVA